MYRCVRCFLCGAWLVLVLSAGCRMLEDEPMFPYPREGLLLYYTFDEGRGRVVTDESGQGGEALLHGGATWTRAGARRGAVAFDGNADSFIEDTDGGTRFNGLTAVTLSVWIKSNTTGTDAGVLICEPPQGDDRALSIRYDVEGAATGGQNVIKGGITVNGSVQVNFESASDLQTTGWQHLVMTWTRGSRFQLYVNNSPVRLPRNPTTTGTLQGMSTLLVGKGSKDAEQSWDGLIDELYIYDRVLLADEINQLYLRGL